MSDSRPIGVFDSGLGGLTVAKEIFRLMPGEKIIYLGDTARCPYGGRSDDTIISFGLQDARYLMEQDIKMLIVACNTVSSVALEQITLEIKEYRDRGSASRSQGCCAAQQRGKWALSVHRPVRTESYARAIQNIDAG